jgi:hypothetical protein
MARHNRLPPSAPARARLSLLDQIDHRRAVLRLYSVAVAPRRTDRVIGHLDSLFLRTELDLVHLDILFEQRTIFGGNVKISQAALCGLVDVNHAGTEQTSNVRAAATITPRTIAVAIFISRSFGTIALHASFLC